jgi:hypothetical protein
VSRAALMNVPIVVVSGKSIFVIRLEIPKPATVLR